MLGAAAGADAPLAPTDANTLSTRTAVSWPFGHVAGALASLMGRRSSNVVSQDLQRNSYNGMSQVYVTATRA